MRKILVSLLIAIAIFSGQVPAYAVCSWTTISNGTTADAVQVMNNFDCLAPSSNPIFSGRVGIGTSSPTLGMLQIEGTAAAHIGNNANAFTARNSANSDRYFYNVYSDTSGNGLAVLYNNAQLDTIRMSSAGVSYLTGGNVGIGTTSPAQALEVNGTIRQSGCTNMPLSANASGDIICTVSDARRKIIRGPFKDGLDALSRIAPVTFTYKPTRSDPKEAFVHAGFVAQEVARVIPEATSLQRDGYYALDSTAILAASVNAIRQLKAENDGLAARITLLESRLSEIEPGSPHHVAR